MPTVLSHAIFSTSFASAVYTKPMPTRFWVLAALCTVIPDLDVIAFIFGVPYSSVWGHRGVTHSLVFALALGVVIALVFFGRLGMRERILLGLFFAVATVTHLALDSLTNVGLGVAAFAPFDSGRYFAPWRPIQVSPIGGAFFSAAGMAVLASEALWVWVPAFALLAVGMVRRQGVGREAP